MGISLRYLINADVFKKFLAVMLNKRIDSHQLLGNRSMTVTDLSYFMWQHLSLYTLSLHHC